MRSLRSVFSICVVALLPRVAFAVEDDACGLYLAHSSVFGRIGVYTAQTLEQGTILDTQDIVIPLMEDEGPLFMDQTTWSRLLGYVEWEGRTVRALISGTGGAVNLHSRLYNIEPIPTNHHNHHYHGLHRVKDAGAGAFSYQSLKYKVTETIPAGGQLLLNNVMSRGGTITPIDAAAMDGAVGQLHNLFRALPEKKPDLAQDLLTLVHGALPPDLSDTFPATQQQYQRAKNDGVSNAWKLEDLAVTPAWLQRNGACVDQLQSDKPSTVEQAGRGAFATRKLEAGSVVAPTPVVPISRVALEKEYDDAHQLLRNYCFGHTNSSLLLCPYGSPASYVNHATDRANVKLRWSTNLDSAHEKLAKLSVEEVLDLPEPGLVLELVATKAIQKDDEILLDYGPNWIEEWQAHVMDWKAVDDAHLYQSAAQLNREQKGNKLKTQEEQLEKPYPQNVFLSARYHFDPHAESTETSNGGRVYSWSQPPSDTVLGLTRPALIRERRGVVFGNDAYTIELMNHPLMPEWDLQYLSEHIIVTGVPRDALFFVDAPFTSDHHMENAFRSEIQIPDDIFPEAWIDMHQADEEYFSEHMEEFFEDENGYYEYLEEGLYDAEDDEEYDEL